MPRRRRLVTFLTTCFAALLGALIAAAILVAGGGRRDGAARHLAGVLRRLGRPAGPAAGRERRRSRSGSAARYEPWPAGRRPRCGGSRSKSTGSACSTAAACRPARWGGCGPRAPKTRWRPAATRWSAKAGSSGVIVLPEQAPTEFGGRVVAFNGRLPDGRPGILAHLYHEPAGAAHLRPRLLAGARPRHLRHPPRRHRPGTDAAHRPHHLLRPAPPPHLRGRRRTPQLPQRRLPGPGRVPERQLPAGPRELRLRRREDRLRHAGPDLPRAWLSAAIRASR